MNALSRTVIAVAGLLFAAQAGAEITFFENERFQGRSFSTDKRVKDFTREGFNDRASSVIVASDRWEVCQDTGFSGRCVVLVPGRYPSMRDMGLNDRVSSVREVRRNARVDEYRYAPIPLASQITFYEQEAFRGRFYTTDEPVDRLNRYGFNNHASSVEVLGERWEICEKARYKGNCVILRPGRYPNLSAMGMNNAVSSARAVDINARIDDRRYAPEPTAHYDYRRRNYERLYEAHVTSVRAVLGTPEQRCWVDRSQVSNERSSHNVPGAIFGAIIGGVLGHQIGGGSGQDLATAGGAVAGGVIGANVGRNDRDRYDRDVQRCNNVPGSGSPDYWDVTYVFRGQEHRMQMTVAPGATVTVNEQGEPRVP